MQHSSANERVAAVMLSKLHVLRYALENACTPVCLSALTVAAPASETTRTGLILACYYYYPAPTYLPAYVLLDPDVRLDLGLGARSAHANAYTCMLQHRAMKLGDETMDETHAALDTALGSIAKGCAPITGMAQVPPPSGLGALFSCDRLATDLRPTTLDPPAFLRTRLHQWRPLRLGRQSATLTGSSLCIDGRRYMVPMASSAPSRASAALPTQIAQFPTVRSPPALLPSGRTLRTVPEERQMRLAQQKGRGKSSISPRRLLAGPDCACFVACRCAAALCCIGPSSCVVLGWFGIDRAGWLAGWLGGWAIGWLVLAVDVLCLAQNLERLPFWCFMLRRGPLLGPILQHPDDIVALRQTFLSCSFAAAMVRRLRVFGSSAQQFAHRNRRVSGDTRLHQQSEHSCRVWVCLSVCLVRGQGLISPQLYFAAAPPHDFTPVRLPVSPPTLTRSSSPARARVFSPGARLWSTDGAYTTALLSTPRS
jgi:hypothetical protein